MILAKPLPREKAAPKRIRRSPVPRKARAKVMPKCKHCAHPKRDHECGTEPRVCGIGHMCERCLSCPGYEPAPIKRRTKVRSKSKRPLRLVRDDVWALFAAYVKERDGNVCFSCGKGGLEGKGWHAGHMFPSGNNAILRYEPKNVHSQCGRCNCFLGGNGAAYASRFLETYGQDEFVRLDGMRGREKKWRRAELTEMGEALKRGGADFECWYAERYGLRREA